MSKKISPELASALMRKNNLIPLEPYVNAMTKWKCKCSKCGETVYPTYSNIKSGHSGCGYCAGNLIPEKRIQSLLRKNKLKPLSKYPGTTKPWRCECLKCGKKVSPHLGSLVAGQGGCIYCAGRKVDSEDAVKFFEQKGFQPLTSYPGGNKPWLSRCSKCGYQIAPSYSDVKRGVGCKICGRKEIPEKIAVQRWKENNLKPLVKFPGATKPWKSECLVCHRKISPWYSQPTCKFCAGRAVVPAEAVTLMKKSKLLPVSKYPGAMKPWLCECMKCGREVSPTYSSVRLGQGCKYCANLGFQYEAAAILYLITHPDLGAHKIGIAGKKRNNSRLREHTRQGWIVLKTMDFEVGDDAYEVEQLTLLWVREDLGLPPYVGKRKMPQSGYTETINAEEIDALMIWKQVEKLSRSVLRRRAAEIS
jgi:recombinational DNA repair protein (RecF pathway)